MSPLSRSQGHRYLIPQTVTIQNLPGTLNRLKCYRSSINKNPMLSLMLITLLITQNFGLICSQETSTNQQNSTNNRSNHDAKDSAHFDISTTETSDQLNSSEIKSPDIAAGTIIEDEEHGSSKNVNPSSSEPDSISFSEQPQLDREATNTVDSVLASQSASQESLEFKSSPSSQVIGIVSSVVSTLVNNGLTTLLNTQVYGTYIGTVYAHLAKTQTTLLSATPSLSSVATSSPVSESTSRSLPTGLISQSVRTEVNEDVTTLFTTQVHGTFLNGVYAHFGQVSSSIIQPTSTKPELSSKTVEFDVNSLVSVSVSTEINAAQTTFHTAEVYQTMISGFSAQFTRTHSQIIEGSETSTSRPFLVFPSRKPRLSTVLSSSIEPSPTSVLTVTKTITATPSVFGGPSLLGYENDDHNEADQSPNNPAKNSIYYEEHGTEYYDNREDNNDKPEVEEYDPEADENVHHEEAVNHPDGRRHRPTREENRFYDYEGPPSQGSSYNSDYSSEQTDPRLVGSFNGRYSGYESYQANPAPNPAPAPVGAPQARFKGVFGARVGSNSQPSVSTGRGSAQRVPDPFASYVTAAPAPVVAVPTQPAAQPANSFRGRYPTEPVSVRRSNYAPAVPAVRPVEILQPFQNIHETLGNRDYSPNQPQPQLNNRRPTNGRSQRRRNNVNSRSEDYESPRPAPQISPARSLPARYQTPSRGRTSSNNRGNSRYRARPTTSYEPPPTIIRNPIEPELDEEDVIEQPVTRGRNVFAVSSRQRNSGKTRRIVLGNVEPSRPVVQLLPTFFPNQGPVITPPLELSTLSTPDLPKTPITITSLVSVVKTLPIRHGFLTSYATITTTAFNSSVISPNNYELVINPTNTAEILTIFTRETVNPTKVIETLITTTTLLEVKLIPIRIGFSTRTDTSTDTQVLTAFSTTERIIHQTVHHAFPGFSFPANVNNGDPNAAAAAAVAAAVAAVGQSGGGQPGLPYGQPFPGLSFSRVTSSFVTTSTVTSTRVLSIALQGKIILSTLTDTSTIEATVTTTNLVPVTIATPAPIRPAVVTTSLTLYITGDGGDVTELVTAITLPGAIFHTKVQRDIRPTDRHHPLNLNPSINLTPSPSLSPSIFTGLFHHSPDDSANFNDHATSDMTAPLSSSSNPIHLSASFESVKTPSSDASSLSSALLTNDITTIFKGSNREIYQASAIAIN